MTIYIANHPIPLADLLAIEPDANGWRTVPQCGNARVLVGRGATIWQGATIGRARSSGRMRSSRRSLPSSPAIPTSRR